MKAQTDAPDTVTTLQERIKRLKRDHGDTMAKLSAYYAQDTEDDALDQYYQTDDSKYFDDLPRGDEWAEHYSTLEVRKL